jgi:hypothetical protein
MMTRVARLVLTLGIMCIFLTGSVAQIEHAPTVAQCQADQRLWFSRLEDTTSSLPTYDVLRQWGSEMQDCQTVDPNNASKYINVYMEVDASLLTRTINFLARHKLFQSFVDEDAAGQR